MHKRICAGKIEFADNFLYVRICRYPRKYLLLHLIITLDDQASTPQLQHNQPDPDAVSKSETEGTGIGSHLNHKLPEP